MSLWHREPVLVLAVIESAIALVTAFGFQLDATQVGAIMAIAAAVLGIVTRSQVSPAMRRPPPPPSARSGHPPIPGLCLCLAVLLTGCQTPPVGAPCDAATLAGIVAECSLRVEQECANKDVPEEQCQALQDCDKRLDERAEKCR